MPINLSKRSSFLRRLLMPFCVLILLLSLTVNVLLVVFRQPAVSLSSDHASSFVSSSSASGALAFGIIERPIPVVSRIVDESGGTVKPVKGYGIPASILLALPKELPVYRDQGVSLESEFVTSFFASIGAEIDPVTLQLLPDTLSFRSADGRIGVSFAAPSRTLTITRFQTAPAPSTTPRADDNEVIALAKTFANSLGIELRGNPQILETGPVDGQPGQTLVTWPMTINALPVFTADGSPIAALTIQVGRVSHRAINARAFLFLPNVLASSSYTVAASQSVTSLLLSGGLLPIPKDLKGAMAMYDDLETVYVLLPQKNGAPTYLVPMLHASFSVDGRAFKTLVPLLDEEQFKWRS